MTNWQPSPVENRSIDALTADLLVVGASVRAAVQSARRAGLSVVAVDLFGDRDLVELCPTIRLSRGWDELLSVAPQLNVRHWIYTGGLENHPRIVAALANRWPLLGADLSVLARVRDPRWLAALFARHGIDFPLTMSATEWAQFQDSSRDSAVDIGGEWLGKPVRSAGGHQIGWVGEIAAARSRNRGGGWYQRYVRGGSYSGVFLAGSTCSLLGVTRQLVGQRWLGAQPFQYCGSIGPLELPAVLAEQWARVGHLLADEGELTGLFGVDAIVDGAGRLWPVEVNPRYSASAEVLERADGYSVIGKLMEMDRWPVSPAARRLGSPGGEAGPCQGKAILYAPSGLVVGEPLCEYLDRANRWAGTELYADLPWPGQWLEAGSPILTVFAGGRDAAQVERRLRRRVEWLWSFLR
ncbi:MAG: ATP-grasp domain-containing protein [Pirellulales bacterium]